MNNITVILNCYKRPEYLKEQINAINNQSVKPEEIMIWYNKPEDKPQYDLTQLGCKVATCNHNFKFHGRFAFGLLAKTEYVAFFDDDTIPGVDWFKNCLEHIKDEDRILGSTGVLLQQDIYDGAKKIGWNGENNVTLKDVDLVGHAWFMKRNTLKYLWQEYPLSWENGEDIQLSSWAYQYAGIKTSVPPHPINDRNLWGSIRGMELGNDNNASWLKKNHFPLRNQIVNDVIKNGYKRVLKR